MVGMVGIRLTAAISHHKVYIKLGGLAQDFMTLSLDMSNVQAHPIILGKHRSSCPQDSMTLGLVISNVQEPPKLTW